MDRKLFDIAEIDGQFRRKLVQRFSGQLVYSSPGALSFDADKLGAVQCLGQRRSQIRAREPESYSKPALSGIDADVYKYIPTLQHCQCLQDLRTFALLQTQHLKNVTVSCNISVECSDFAQADVILLTSVIFL